MAFNLQTFRTRTITSFIFIAVMLTGLLLNQWSFFLLFSIIHFGCWFEYQKIISLITPAYKQISPLHRYLVMLAGWGFMLWMCDSNFVIGLIPLQQIGFWLMLSCIIAFPLSEFLMGGKDILPSIGYSFLGLLYISLAWGLLMDLYTIYIEWRLPLVIIIVIWINDTMAYLVGSMIGKTPLSKISPKKTWEGTLGGILLSIITICVFYYHEEKAITQDIIIIALITAVAGTFGDLLESKLKRMADIKDSGSFMPGHGGFLDRFDSLLIATTCVWIYLKIAAIF